ncbi:hypothetical protein EVAR_99928_1 [Eumeta japonica]|uniref:Uncharacterized protein n=1 Tax=Eumeta variegata TaxID=151549 RepID=A0A4C1Z0Y5_EUMVA|nr:hypothetical protein EVAR_99928_1 [Eumeta japonica]
MVAMIMKELLCTYRNPIDVAYALNEYGGIYSSMTRVRSLRLERIRKRRRDTCPDYQQSTRPDVIVRITAKHKLHDSVSLAVVGITLHTVSCVYYRDDGEDATGRFIKMAVAASENKIKDYNVKMAIRNWEKTIMNVLAENWKQ